MGVGGVGPGDGPLDGVHLGHLHDAFVGGFRHVHSIARLGVAGVPLTAPVAYRVHDTPVATSDIVRPSSETVPVAVDQHEPRS